MSTASPERALLRGLRRTELVRGIGVAREAGALEAEANLSLELGATFEVDGAVDAAASQYERAVGISRALGDADGERAAKDKLAALRREPDSLRELGTTSEPRGSRKAASSDALEISTEGAAFRAPGTRKFVAIQGRTPLRRILVELARRRLDSPGACVLLAELGRAGWPGEDVAAASLAQRVRVATSALRKLGLAQVILTARGGYLIAPIVAVVFSE